MNEIERGLDALAGIGLDRDAEAARVRETLLPAVEEKPPEAKPERMPKPPRPFDNQRHAPGSPRDVIARAVVRQYERGRLYTKVAMTRSERNALDQYARAYRISRGLVLRICFNMIERDGQPLRFFPVADEEETKHS